MNENIITENNDKSENMKSTQRLILLIVSAAWLLFEILTAPFFSFGALYVYNGQFIWLWIIEILTSISFIVVTCLINSSSPFLYCIPLAGFLFLKLFGVINIITVIITIFAIFFIITMLPNIKNKTPFRVVAFIMVVFGMLYSFPWSIGIYERGFSSIFSYANVIFSYASFALCTLFIQSDSKKRVEPWRQYQNPAQNLNAVFCTKCGTHNALGARFCISCGNELSQPSNQMGYQNVYQNPNPYQNQNPYQGTYQNLNDAPSFGFAVLGFFFPIIGLILYLTEKRATPLKARSAGRGALVGAIVCLLITIAYFVIYFLILKSASHAFRF